MKYIFLILITGTLFAQNETVVQKSDSDSLWQTINSVYELSEDVVVIRAISEYGFILRESDKEFICNSNTMPKYFYEALKQRKKKNI